MNIPKVTVLMPVYNGEKYLHESIGSILNQTFTNFEFVIINDCSVDKSAEIIKSFRDPRIRYFENDKNMGLIATLNKGLNFAQGEYIARMDQDDISLPERLSQQVSFLDCYPEVGVLGTAVQLIKSDGTNINSPLCFPSSSNCIEWCMYFYCPIAHPAVLMRKDVVMRVGGYAIEALHAEDYDLWVRLSKVTQLSNLAETLLKLRKHDSNMTKVFLSENLNIADKISQRFVTEHLGEQVVNGISPFGTPSMAFKDPLMAAKIIFKLYSKIMARKSLSSVEVHFIRQDAGRRLFSLILHNPLPIVKKIKILVMIMVVSPAGAFRYGVRWIKHRAISF